MPDRLLGSACSSLTFILLKIVVEPSFRPAGRAGAKHLIRILLAGVLPDNHRQQASGECMPHQLKSLLVRFADNRRRRYHLLSSLRKHKVLRNVIAIPLVPDQTFDMRWRLVHA